MAAPSGQRDIKWVEGLRGIAAIFIVTSHLCLAFWETLRFPGESQDKLGSILRLPILRLPFGPSPWLSTFFLLTGFVNAYKPIKQARSADTSSPLIGLASSAFRRPWRLMLPTTLITIIIWFMTQLGFFALGRRCAAFWMRDTSPEINPSWLDAIDELFRNIYVTWRGSPGDSNVYDKNQWCMPLLLKGSMLIYIAMLATFRCSPKYRMLVFFLLFLYNYDARDTMFGSNIYFGALLAEVSMHFPASSTSQTIPRRILAFGLLAFGLLAAGYPEHYWEWSSWSRGLAQMGFRMFPANAPQFGYWPAIGAQCIASAIVLSFGLQQLLSHPFLVWLGGISFPVYLIHGSLIRSLLAWMLFGFRKPVWLYTKNVEGVFYEEWEIHPMPEAWMYMLAIPAFFVILVVMSHYWNVFVEPFCAYITLRAEETMCPQLAEAQKHVERLEKGLPLPHGLVRGDV